MRISRPLAGTAIAAGVLGASLGLGLTMASASTSASPAVTHPAAASSARAASTTGSSRAAGATGFRSKPAARSAAQAARPMKHPCRNMPGQHGSASSSGSSPAGS